MRELGHQRLYFDVGRLSLLIHHSIWKMQENHKIATSSRISSFHKQHSIYNIRSCFTKNLSHSGRQANQTPCGDSSRVKQAVSEDIHLHVWVNDDWHWRSFGWGGIQAWKHMNLSNGNDPPRSQKRDYKAQNTIVCRTPTSLYFSFLRAGSCNTYEFFPLPLP